MVRSHIPAVFVTERFQKRLRSDGNLGLSDDGPQNLAYRTPSPDNIPVDAPLNTPVSISIEVPCIQTQSLKECIAYGGTLYDPFLKMRMYTESVQNWLGSNSLDGYHPGLECVCRNLVSKSALTNRR